MYSSGDRRPELTPARRRLTGVLAWLVAFHTLLAFGLPPAAFVVLVLVLAVLFVRSGALAAVATAGGLLAVTLLYALAIELLDLDAALYYRPHERLEVYDYVADHRSYRPNAEVRMRMPHGDLQSMTREAIAQSREVVFRTDTEGFRNDRDYHGQRYVLVGDSFIAALGDSQEHTLDRQLARDHRIESYNLGHPGDPADYLAYIRGFRHRHGEDFRVLLFLFEGNDLLDHLRAPGRKRHSGASLAVKRYYNLFSGTGAYRLTKSLIKRATQYGEIARSEGVVVLPLGAARMGFHRPYIDITRAPAYQPGPELEQTLLAMRPQIDQVFFIPTKYRVYHHHVAPREPLPHARWDWLAGTCRKNGLRCTDLTPALVAASDRLLAGGRFTWWLDDTHWNAEGMAAAAASVSAALAGRAP